MHGLAGSNTVISVRDGRSAAPSRVAAVRSLGYLVRSMPLTLSASAVLCGGALWSGHALAAAYTRWLFTALAQAKSAPLLLGWAIGWTALLWGVFVPAAWRAWSAHRTAARTRARARARWRRLGVAAGALGLVLLLLAVLWWLAGSTMAAAQLVTLGTVHLVVTAAVAVPVGIGLLVAAAERAHARRLGRPLPKPTSADRRARYIWRQLGGVLLLAVADTLVAAATTAVLAVCGFLLFEVGAAPLLFVAVLIVVVFMAYALILWGRLRIWLAHAAFGPRRRLDRQLVEVTASRARLLDAFEAERRRIERDLHDGAQQRLTALIMKLGLLRLDLGEASPQVRTLAAEAQEEAGAALRELRDLVRGIYPQVLADRGLGAAVDGLAERCPVPATATVDFADRLPEQIESAAYFVLAEALTNVAKHSGATHATVTVRVSGGTLVMEVRDNGNGGADPTGAGLVGLADRVAVHHGILGLSSPAGGPTVLRIEIPIGQGERAKDE